MENAIRNISGPDTSMTKTSGITYTSMDAEGHVYALLYEMASVLCKSPSGDFNPTASSLRSFPVMKTITLYLHMCYFPGFSGLKWWGIAWLSVPPAARRWLGRLTHPKIWLTDTNVKSVLLQHKYSNVRHTCSATQVGAAISAAWSTKIHTSFSFSYFVVNLLVNLTWKKSPVWYCFCHTRKWLTGHLSGELWAGGWCCHDYWRLLNSISSRLL